MVKLQASVEALLSKDVGQLSVDEAKCSYHPDCALDLLHGWGFVRSNCCGNWTPSVDHSRYRSTYHDFLDDRFEYWDPDEPPPHALLQFDFPSSPSKIPHAWINQCELYFDCHQMPFANRLRIRSFNLDSEVSKWLQWQKSEGHIHNLHDFCDLLLDRFNKENSESLMCQFARIKQSSSVRRYIKDFESLASQVHGLTSCFHFDTFISGLKPELKWELLSIHPWTILEAKNHAILHEGMYQDLRHMFGCPNQNDSFQVWSF